MYVSHLYGNIPRYHEKMHHENIILIPSLLLYRRFTTDLSASRISHSVTTSDIADQQSNAVSSKNLPILPCSGL